MFTTEQFPAVKQKQKLHFHPVLIKAHMYAYVDNTGTLEILKQVP